MQARFLLFTNYLWKIRITIVIHVRKQLKFSKKPQKEMSLNGRGCKRPWAKKCHNPQGADWSRFK